MTISARQLLDDQTRALLKLRDTARFVYCEAAALPGLPKESAASLLADLVTDSRAALDVALDAAEHLLFGAEPVTVSLPIGNRDCSSACCAAGELLFELAAWVQVSIDDSGLPEQKAAVESRLLSSADEAVIWRMLPTFDPHGLQGLANTVNTEVHASIERLNGDFILRTGLPTPEAPDSKPDTGQQTGQQKKNRSPVPQSTDALRLAKLIRDNTDPHRTRTQIAREYCEGTDLNPDSLLRKLRDFPRLLERPDTGH